MAKTLLEFIPPAKSRRDFSGGTAAAGIGDLTLCGSHPHPLVTPY